jgi:hypothetical protein
MTMSWPQLRRGRAIPAISTPVRGFVRLLPLGRGSTSEIARELQCRNLRTLANLSVGCHVLDFYSWCLDFLVLAIDFHHKALLIL